MLYFQCPEIATIGKLTFININFVGNYYVDLFLVYPYVTESNMNMHYECS